MQPRPDLATFLELCRPGRAVPVRLEVDADTETPVSAFLKLRGDSRQAFLLESVEGGEHAARFSFLGARPQRLFSWRLGDAGDPFEIIRQTLATHEAVQIPGLPRFCGGLVGYLAYDLVKLFEPRVPIANSDELGFPDILLMDFDSIVAFDNLRHSVHVIAEARCNTGDDPQRLYADAVTRIRRTLRILSGPLRDERPRRRPRPARLTPRVDRATFEAMVTRAKEYIQAGDCQQIVPSQRFDATIDVPPFELYRALRRVNPSPFLFYLEDGDRALVGSSPETLVKLEDGEVIVRPLAGTRRRGRDAAEDRRLEEELHADPKENAEHVMLVDLGRNDVGRVSEIGSVRVTDFKKIERYSHVMHIVSEVRGRLTPGLGALDVLRAAFPAGTVSGAPKVRAMEIIDELEPARRGPYAGAVGYFDRGGGMEMCIAIRTLLQSGKRVSVQAGAGIVYDSQPATEYEETVNKATALFTAVAQAEARLASGPPLASAAGAIPPEVVVPRRKRRERAHHKNAATKRKTTSRNAATKVR